MLSHTVQLRLSDPIFRIAMDVAIARGISPGQLVRDALGAELRHAVATARTGPDGSTLYQSKMKKDHFDAES